MSDTQAAGEGNQPGRHPSPAPIPVAEAIARLDKLGYQDPEWKYTDPEENHIKADDVLLAAVDPLIAEAYKRVVERVDGFWYA